MNVSHSQMLCPNGLNGSGKNGTVLSFDDGGGGYNSRIIRTLLAETYTIEATTFSESTTGSFTVTVN